MKSISVMIITQDSRFTYMYNSSGIFHKIYQINNGIENRCMVIRLSVCIEKHYTITFNSDGLVQIKKSAGMGICKVLTGNGNLFNIEMTCALNFFSNLERERKKEWNT